MPLGKGMKKFVYVPLIAALAGCASGPPTPVLPDGSAKHPVNDPESVKAFLLSRQLAESQQQLADAKQQLALLRAGQLVAGHVQPGPTVYVSEGRVVPSSSSQPATSVDGQAALYRVSFEFGSTKFEPPADMVNTLVSAAMQASRVELRGRTDSPVKDDADQRIALGRALAARRYLVAQGVAANKIRVSYLSSGDFIADNSTAEGKAKNRRVDIALTGVQAASSEHNTRVTQ